LSIFSNAKMPYKENETLESTISRFESSINDITLALKRDESNIKVSKKRLKFISILKKRLFNRFKKEEEGNDTNRTDTLNNSINNDKRMPNITSRTMKPFYRHTETRNTPKVKTNQTKPILTNSLISLKDYKMNSSNNSALKNMYNRLKDSSRSITNICKECDVNKRQVMSYINKKDLHKIEVSDNLECLKTPDEIQQIKDIKLKGFFITGGKSLKFNKVNYIGINSENNIYEKFNKHNVISPNMAMNTNLLNENKKKHWLQTYNMNIMKNNSKKMKQIIYDMKTIKSKTVNVVS
jgi:hypothetical protein